MLAYPCAHCFKKQSGRPPRWRPSRLHHRVGLKCPKLGLYKKNINRSLTRAAVSAIVINVSHRCHVISSSCQKPPEARSHRLANTRCCCACCKNGARWGEELGLVLEEDWRLLVVAGEADMAARVRFTFSQENYFKKQKKVPCLVI